MKKLLVVIPAMLALFACHDYKADISKLEQEKQSLIDQAGYKDSTITSFIGSVNEIETNLNAIEELQNKLKENNTTGELQGSQVDRINENIRSINELLNANKEKIASLNKKLRAAGGKNKELEKMIAALNENLTQKDQQLAELNTKLADMGTQIEKLNTDVTTLVAQNTERQTKIDDQTTRLQTAYYTTGTYKELYAKKVVNKQGGFLGIGRTKTLQRDFNNTAFSKIDITQTTTIPLEVKDAKLLTSHPTSSYTIEHKGKAVSNLVITDPDKFWESSKYLVVVVNK